MEWYGSVSKLLLKFDKYESQLGQTQLGQN
jgi:hypothetical protein